MQSRFPSAKEYSAQVARYAPLTVLDVSRLQERVVESYLNEVLSDVNDHCVRMSVFEGQYRWHEHPDTDELFVVMQGKLQIDLLGGTMVELEQWQCIVIPAGVAHRTRAIGRTVNLTIEKQGATTVFLDGPEWRP